MFASLLKCRFTKFIPCKSTVENHVELSFDDTRHYTTHSILLLNKPVHTPTQYNTYPMRQAFLLSELSQCHTTHTTDNASSSQGPLRLVDPKPTPAPSAKLDLWLWGCTLRTWTSCSPRTHKTAHGLKPNRRMHRSCHFPLAIEVFEILKNYRVYLFISLLLAYSPSTAQVHLRAFHKFKFRAPVEHNTKHAHYINVKHTNINQKVVPSGSLS